MDTVAIEDQTRDKTILVTGTGGSIESELVSQFAKFFPRKVVLLGHGKTASIQFWKK